MKVSSREEPVNRACNCQHDGEQLQQILIGLKIKFAGKVGEISLGFGCLKMSVL